MTNPNDPAFPKLSRHQSDLDIKTWLYDSIGGLTKREYFAAMAMNGLMAMGAPIDDTNNPSAELYAQYAIHAADALIAELNMEVK